MDFLPKEIREGLELARKRDLRKKARLRVTVGDISFPVLDYREAGFALDLDNAPKLRGLVDIFDGARHLSQCLIVASEEDGDLMRYEFKRVTAATDRPPVDFAIDENAPVALLPRG